VGEAVAARTSRVSSRLTYARQSAPHVVRCSAPRRVERLVTKDHVVEVAQEKESALRVCVSRTTCGKSLIVRPSAAARMLYGDRSPWMRSQHSIEMS